MLQQEKAAVIAAADAQHTQYPQYRGHWSTPEWRLVRVTRRVSTKLGVAFEKGDVTIARWSPADRPWTQPQEFVTAYSIRTRIDTSIRASAVRWLEERP